MGDIATILFNSEIPATILGHDISWDHAELIALVKRTIIDKESVAELDKYLKATGMTNLDVKIWAKQRGLGGKTGTMMHFACLKERVEIVKYLLSKRVKLHLALEDYSIGWDFRKRRNEHDGLTALEIAKKRGCQTIVTLIEEHLKNNPDNDSDDSDSEDTNKPENNIAQATTQPNASNINIPPINTTISQNPQPTDNAQTILTQTPTTMSQNPQPNASNMNMPPSSTTMNQQTIPTQTPTISQVTQQNPSNMNTSPNNTTLTPQTGPTQTQNQQTVPPDINLQNQQYAYFLYLSSLFGNMQQNQMPYNPYYPNPQIPFPYPQVYQNPLMSPMQQMNQQTPQNYQNPQIPFGFQISPQMYPQSLMFPTPPMFPNPPMFPQFNQNVQMHQNLGQQIPNQQPQIPTKTPPNQNPQ